MNTDSPESDLDIYDNVPAPVVKWIEHVLKADKEHPFSVKEVHLIEKDKGWHCLSIELTEFITFANRRDLQKRIADILSLNAIQDYDVRIVTSNPLNAWQYDNEIREIEKFVRESLPSILKDTWDTWAHTAELQLRPTRLLWNMMRIFKRRKWSLVFGYFVKMTGLRERYTWSVTWYCGSKNIFILN